MPCLKKENYARFWPPYKKSMAPSVVDPPKFVNVNFFPGRSLLDGCSNLNKGLNRNSGLQVCTSKGV